MSSRSLPVSYVKVGTRYRKDLGDLSSLADSIRAIGLIHPIVVDGNHKLIAGQRRFEAWKLAKPDQAVPAVVVTNLDDAVSRLLAERDENTCRKDMTATELYELGKQIEKLERPKAAARQARPGAPRSSVSGGTNVRTAEKVAPGLGMSARNWSKLKQVGDAAAEGDESAKQDLGDLDAGETTLNAVYERRRGARPDLPDTVGNVRSLPKRRPAAHILDKASEQLDGIASMLETLDMSEVKPAEAERLAASLSRSRSVLSRTINSLRSIA